MMLRTSVVDVEILVLQRVVDGIVHREVIALGHTGTLSGVG